MRLALVAAEPCASQRRHGGPILLGCVDMSTRRGSAHRQQRVGAQQELARALLCRTATYAARGSRLRAVIAHRGSGSPSWLER